MDLSSHGLQIRSSVQIHFSFFYLIYNGICLEAPVNRIRLIFYHITTLLVVHTREDGQEDSQMACLELTRKEEMRNSNKKERRGLLGLWGRSSLHTQGDLDCPPHSPRNWDLEAC